MARAGRRDRAGCEDARGRGRRTIITSLPKPAALDATVAAIVGAGVRPRVIVEACTFTIDDKLKAERALRKAGHVMLDCPVSGTGSQAQVTRISWSMPAATPRHPPAAPAVRRLLPRDA